MAMLFDNDEFIKCECGNKTFTEREVFALAPRKLTGSGETVYQKHVSHYGLVCTKCGREKNFTKDRNKVTVEGAIVVS